MKPDKKKNIVEGGISNVKGNVEIGDKTTIIHETPKQSKELSLNLPVLREDQIIGRTQDLKDIYQRLFDHKKVVLVNGMGGIGKTTLAQVYLTKYYDAYKHIAWISFNAEKDDFESDFINTEGILNRFKIKQEGKTINDLFLELIGALKEIKEQPCLMVLDNATNEAGKYYNYLPNPPNWHVLVTSREQIPNFDLKELDFLKEADAIKLFKKHYTFSQLTEKFLIELVRKLEYHTLTIEILAKTAQNQRSTPDKLMQAIENDLATNISVRHSSESVEKITSYLCSIFKITQLNAEEKDLLLQFICLPPDFQAYSLLVELLYKAKENDNITLAQTLNALTQKGWLLYNKDTDSYKIHRIIIDVVKRLIDLNEENVDALIENISSKLSLDRTKDNPIDKFKWIPFGKVIVNNFKDSIIAPISKLQNNLALVLKALGDYEEAKKLLEKAVKSNEENFGIVHPSTAVSYSNLATVLQDLGGL